MATCIRYWQEKTEGLVNFHGGCWVGEAEKGGGGGQAGMMGHESFVCSHYGNHHPKHDYFFSGRLPPPPKVR